MNILKMTGLCSLVILSDISAQQIEYDDGYFRSPLGTSIDHIRGGIIPLDFNRDGVFDSFWSTTTGVSSVSARGNITITDNYEIDDIRTNGTNNFQYKHLIAIDFNHNGVTDVVGWHGTEVYLLEFSPTGQFTSSVLLPSTVISAIGSSRGTAFTDLNNDGDYDLVFSTGANVGSLSYGVIVCLNNGSIPAYTSCTNHSDTQTGLRNSRTGISDLNHDGLDDLLVVGKRDGETEQLLRLYSNNGDGTFTETNLGAETSLDFNGLIEVSDIDNDGQDEVIVLNTVDRELGFFDGSLGEPFNYMTIANNLLEPSDIEVGDVDNNGKIDIVIGSRTQGQMTVYTQNEPGVFNANDFQTIKPNPKWFKLVDLDNDGDLDVSSSYLDTSYNGFQAQFLTSKHRQDFLLYQQRMESLTGDIHTNRSMTHDMNRDGLMDIVEVKRTTTDTTGGELRIHFQQTDGNFILSGNLASVPLGEVIQMDIADMNSDGYDDVVTTSSNRNEVAVHYADYEAATFNSVVVDNTIMGAYALAVADMDLNGDQDIVVSSFNSAEVILLNQDAGTFTQRLIAAIPSVTALDVGDISMDGLSDVIVYDFFNNDLQWVEMLPGNDPIHDIDDIWLLNGNAGDVKLVDYDRDGDLDLAVGGYIGAFWMNFDRDTGEFVSPSQPYAVSGIGYVVSIDVKDIDNDGDADWLLGTRGTTQDTGMALAIKTIDRNHADISIGYKKFKVTDHESVVSISGSDMDHDGDIDVAITFKDENVTGVELHSLIGDAIFADQFESL